MNAEDQIIALLNGDLANEAEVAEVVRILSDSPENRRMLLQHTQTSRHIDALGKRSVPSAAAMLGVFNGVADIETRHAAAANASGGSSAARSFRRYAGLGLFFIIAFLLGYCASALRSEHTNADRSERSVGSLDSNRSMPRETARIDTALSISPSDSLRRFDTSGSESRSVPEGPKREEQTKHVPRNPALPELMTLMSDLSASGQVITPNGGEEYTVGDVIPLVWSGTGGNQPVTLDISNNGGTTWKRIGEKIIGNKALWRVPYDAVESDRYLLRVRSANADKPDPVLSDRFSTGNLSVNAVDFSPNGKMIVFGTGNDVVFWDIATRTEIARISEHTHDVYHTDFSPDGSKLVSASRDGTIIIWNVADRTIAHRINPGRGYVWQASFTPDGKSVAAICRDDSAIVFWDVATGNETKVFDHIHSRGMRSFNYTFDGTRLLTTSIDRSVAITDIQTGQVLQRVYHHVGTTYGRMTIVMGAQLTPDDSVLITCGYDGWIKFWNARTGALIREEVYHNGGYVVALRLSQDGRFLTSVGEDGTAKVMNPYTGDLLAEMTLNAADTMSPMKQARLSVDDRFLVVGHGDGEVSMWDMGAPPFEDISDAFWTIRRCDDVVGIDRNGEKNGSPDKPMNFN